MGNRHRNACPSNIYPAADGEIMIFCVSEAHWHAVARSMHREDVIISPRFKDHAARFAIADEVDAMVGEWTQVHHRDALVDVLLESGVPCAPVRTVAEVASDPELKRRKMLIEVAHPTRGSIRVTGSPLKLSDGDYDSTQISPPPTLGQHNDEIYGSIGIGPQELQRLKHDGVI